MRSTLDAPAPLWEAIREDLLATPDLERAAIAFAGVVGNGSEPRLLLRDWTPVPADEYLVQLGYHLEISPAFWARAAKRARGSREALVLLHSHPRDGHPRFSGSDDAGEATLIPRLHQRAEVPVGAVVISPVGVQARLSVPDRSTQPMRVRIVGAPGRGSGLEVAAERFDRQIRALTREGQAMLRGLRVGVVGAGGLGAHVIQQLVHLGVGRVVVIDPDRVAKSNLSRLVGATRFDALLRRPKTRVARRLAQRVGGPTTVVEVRHSVAEDGAVRQLLDCDVIVGCTDNQLSRTVLNGLAFQYYLPVLDLGVELQQGGAMGGRVAWLAPGSACLWCSGILNAERVRTEQLPKAILEAEQARGYIEGIDEPAPAVVSINGVIASLGVTELLARMTAFAGPDPRGDLLLYRLADGVVRRTSPPARPDCPTCSATGDLGAGDLATPPWRS